MTESRKLGWNGFVATDYALLATMASLVDLKMLPSVALNDIEKDRLKYYGY